jgi:hypothetical protein
MKDRDMARYLAEQIRRAITYEHLPAKRNPAHIPPKHPRDPGLCDCDKRLQNSCVRKILEAAFQSYADEHPEEFPIF